MNRLPRLALSMLLILSLAACATRSSHHSSSVVSYLYPDKAEPVVQQSIPRLSLPLNVGIAFVPDESSRNEHLTEQEKSKLLDNISKDFKKYDFVKHIEIIPSAYLRKGGSFANLDQIRTMYGIDVIALVSYDQTQFTDEGVASISYWTIIGAYIIPGEKNDTHTMVDTVVYDIASRKMLFRAPGTSHIKGLATPVNLSEELRDDSLKGFHEASENLIGNLETQLELFREKIKQSPDEYQVTHKSGYTGSGNFDLLLAGLALAIAGIRLWTSRRKP